MKRVHHHPCQRCGKKAECPGEWEQNYDGFPEVICPEFHQNGGINPDFICEDCVERVAGILAYDADAQRTENPHPAGTPEHASWDAGWAQRLNEEY